MNGHAVGSPEASRYQLLQPVFQMVVVAAFRRSASNRAIASRDGLLHPLDVLVIATGFRVDRFVRPMQVVGDRGVVLDDVWGVQGPFAYMTLAVPDFPNFYMLNGPNGPVGNFSLIEVAELQMTYVLQMIERARSGTSRALSPSHAAMARFDAERRTAATTTIWNTGCKSWYLDASGLPTAWPFTFDRFRVEMAQPRFEDWVVHDGV